MMKTQTRPGYLSNVLRSGATPFGQIGRGSGGDPRSETAGRMTSSSSESIREELITGFHSRGAITTADPVPDEIGERRADVLPGRPSNPPQTEKNRLGTASRALIGTAEDRRPEPPAAESASPWTDRRRTIASPEAAAPQTALETVGASPTLSESSGFIPLEEERSSREPENERGPGLWPAGGRQAAASSSHAGAAFSGLTTEMTVLFNPERSETSGAGPEKSSISGESLNSVRPARTARTPRLISATDLPLTAPLPEMRAKSGRNETTLPPAPDRPEEGSHGRLDRLPERSNDLLGAVPDDVQNRAFNEAARYNTAATRQEGGPKLTIQRLEVQIINQVSADRARRVSSAPSPDARENLERRHLGRWF
jgi:hypothetical protein